jgi:hypothetical protein
MLHVHMFYFAYFRAHLRYGFIFWVVTQKVKVFFVCDQTRPVTLTGRNCSQLQAKQSNTSS